MEEVKVFISYCSLDQIVLNEFSDRILKLGLKLSESQIDCSGIEGSSIRSGDKFKEWIAKKIKGCNVAILLISQN